MGSHLRPSHKVQWDRGRRVWERRARNPICLWRSPSASFLSFSIHTLLSSSSVSWQFSCPSLSWCQAHAHCLRHGCSGPCCLGSGVPASRSWCPWLPRVATALALVLCSPLQNLTFLLWKIITVRKPRLEPRYRRQEQYEYHLWTGDK